MPHRAQRKRSAKRELEAKIAVELLWQVSTFIWKVSGLIGVPKTTVVKRAVCILDNIEDELNNFLTTLENYTGTYTVLSNVEDKNARNLG